MKRSFICFSTALLLAACGSQSNQSDQQPKALPANVETYTDAAHFHDLLFTTADMEYTFDKWQSKGFQAWQAAFREALRKRLGITAIEESLQGFQPTAKQEDCTDLGDYTRERWVIQTEPTVPLPIVILRPKNIQGKLPLVITPHGHGKNTEQYAGVYEDEADSISAIDGERNIAVQAIQEGYIAITPTARGFGRTRIEADLKADNTSSCHTLLLHDLLVGRTPIGDRVWDMMKIIDWSLANLPVDADNIIVTGNSGGGTTSLFTGAIDTRVSMSLPGSYFCTFAESIGAMPHCECNYIPGVLDLGEMYDIAGLTAPRYFCAIHGEHDPIFPAKATRFAFGKLQEIYKAAGVPDRCQIHFGPQGHRYYKAGAWPFVKEHLTTASR